MANSGPVTSGQQATAAQYNNLRSDVMDPATGHTHDGVNGAAPGFPFGDGSDGNVTISGGTTLTRDMYYNNLTVNTGVVLNAAAFAIHVLGTLTLSGTGAIAANGGNGANATNVMFGWGAAGTGPTFGVGNGQGQGGQVQSGTGLLNSVAGVSAAGSDEWATMTGGAKGGNASGTAGAATGTAGASNTNIAGQRPWRSGLPLSALVLVPWASGKAVPGAPGGGGGSISLDGGSYYAGSGGGGGGSGWPVYVAARVISGSGSIQSKGGNGGNGSNGQAVSGNSATGGGGGGGGGAGGMIVLLYGRASSWTGTLVVTAGTGGTGGSGTQSGSGVGTAGSAGVTGPAGIALSLQVK